ncbi:MAG TPA: DUF3887 domain-containing protein [Candidatus Kapabacteria bacterium]|nr:DUF3887 domain-containing protein [Candidatus Kapabacteria bacterium]
MTNTILIGILFVLLSSLKVVAQENSQQIADEFLKELQSENFDKAYQNFDSTIVVQFSLKQLKEVWTQIKGQYGDIVNIEEPQTSKMSTSTLLVYPITFKNGALNAQIAVNLFGKISGFFLSMRPESIEYSYPSYNDSTKYEEIHIQFGDPNFPLGATLTIPKNAKSMPIAILVHGSGPHDRDESIGPNKPFKDLAGGLASQGIAVFRYEKRTLEYGSKLDINTLDLNIESIDDVIYALKYIANNGAKINIDTKKVFVIGHSLGASLLPRINNKSNDFRGFVSLAGMTRTIDQVLIEQTQYLYNLDSTFDDTEKEGFEELKRQLINALSPNLSKDTPQDSLPFNLSGTYWLDFRSLNTKSEASAISKPILVLQGEADYQVTMEDFEGWKEALKNNSQATFIAYPSLNHLFMQSSTAKSVPQDYYKPNHIDAKVILDISNWIKKN